MSIWDPQQQSYIHECNKFYHGIYGWGFQKLRVPFGGGPILRITTFLVSIFVAPLFVSSVCGSYHIYLSQASSHKWVRSF